MIKHSFGEEILAAVSRRYSTRSSWEKTVLPVVEELFDKGTSFREVDNARGMHDNLVTGFGSISGCDVGVYGHIHASNAGSISALGAQKLEKLYGECLRRKIPIVGLCNSAGANMINEQRGLYGAEIVLQASLAASGKIPHVSILLGTCVGVASLSVLLSDLIIACESTTPLYLLGPSIIAKVRSNSVDTGGSADISAATASNPSEFFHVLSSGIADSVKLARKYVGYLANVKTLSHDIPTCIPPLSSPLSHKDMISLINSVFDSNSLLETHGHCGDSVITGLARLEGCTIALVACSSQPRALLSVADIRKVNALLKLAKSANVPVVLLLDPPELAPSPEDMKNGIMCDVLHLIETIRSIHNIVAILIGRLFGASFLMLASKKIGSKTIYAWPSATVGVVEPSNATLISRKGDRSQFELSAKAAVQAGFVDAIISPEDTRSTLVDFIRTVNLK